MSKKKPTVATEGCASCEDFLTMIKEYQNRIADLEARLQDAQMKATKFEITLKDNGLLEQTEQVSNCEAIATEQIQRLKDRSAIRDFTETDAKILDILQRNLKVARGEKVEKDTGAKARNLSEGELLKLIKE